MKLTDEQVREELMEEGYELIGEYKNVSTSLELKCKHGNSVNISLKDFRKGERCECIDDTEEVIEESIIIEEPIAETIAEVIEEVIVEEPIIEEIIIEEPIVVKKAKKKNKKTFSILDVIFK